MEEKAITYLLPPSISLPSKIDLGDGTIIREIDQFEKERKNADNLFSMRKWDFDQVKYVIETTGNVEEDLAWEIGESDKHPYGEIENNFDTVILALRLFRPGTIGFHEFDLVGEGDEEIGQIGEIIYGTISRITYFQPREPYVLKDDELEDFIEFYKKIRGLDEISFTKIALERFRRLYEKDHLEDRFLDLFIALESLFLESSNELTYRLSLNVSIYLGNRLGERRNIFENIKKAYLLRSKIVHGANINTDELNKSYKILGEYLRECIKKILIGKQGLGKPDLMKYIEERIFGGSY